MFMRLIDIMSTGMLVYFKRCRFRASGYVEVGYAGALAD